MKDILEPLLKLIRRVAQDFVELLRAPRTHGTRGNLFRPSRFADALAFLGVSAIVLMFLNRRRPSEIEFFYDLGADILWRFATVLVEAGVITGVWRLFKGPGRFSDYVVANCFYFAVLTILGRTGLLILHSLGWSIGLSFRLHWQLWALGVLMGIGIGIWATTAWRAYADHNKAVGRKRWLSLLLAVAGSVPVLMLIWFLRKALRPATAL